MIRETSSKFALACVRYPPPSTRHVLDIGSVTPVPGGAIDDLGASPTREISRRDGGSSGGDGGGTPRRKQWVSRLRPAWSGEKEQAASTHSIEGFICPQCRKKLSSPAALLAHFHVLHGGGVGGGGAGGEDRGGGSDGSSDEGESVRRRERGRLKESRRSWRGSSISLDHFILALQSFMEEQPHEGYVVAR